MPQTTTQALIVPLLAVLVGGLVRAIKGETLNAKLAEYNIGPIPKRALPFLALGLGAASAVLDAMLAGSPWPEAVAKGILAGFAAIVGHEVVIESLRGGKELFGGGAGGPSAGSGPKAGAGVPPKKTGTKVLRMRLATVLFAVVLSACAYLKDAKTATKTVLSFADIACIETGNGAAITDAKQAAIACEMVDKLQDVGPELADIIQRLIGQREAGKRAGFVWGAHLDAGSPDASLDASAGDQ